MKIQVAVFSVVMAEAEISSENLVSYQNPEDRDLH
jgi:hypothetical protein